MILKQKGLISRGIRSDSSDDDHSVLKIRQMKLKMYMRLPKIPCLAIALLLSSVSAKVGNPMDGTSLPGAEESARQNDKGGVRGRIVGGSTVSGPDVYPFFASWIGVCGASLIHSDIALTAAHCNPIPNNTLTIGAYKLKDSTTDGAVVRTILERSIHPYFNGTTLEYDFLLLQLNTAVSHLLPIPLNEEVSVPGRYQKLTTIGLGTTSTGGSRAKVLQQVEVRSFSNRECNTRYNGRVVQDVMFCAGVRQGGKDSCLGDSGGPIFTTTASGEVDKQVGVVSWGYGCARPEYPGVYADVSSIKDWIFDEICRLSDDKPAECFPPTSSPTPKERPTLSPTLKVHMTLGKMKNETP